MLILAIDTATPRSVGVLTRAGEVLAAETVAGAHAHAEAIGPVLRDLLMRADEPITHVVCGVGPGPFTGLRVGVMAARALAAVRSIDAIGVCTLDVIAEHMCRTQTISASFDVVLPARRREIYVATYDRSGQRVEGPDIRPGTPPEEPPALEPDALAHAAYAAVAGGVRALPPDPLYLREPDARPSVAVAAGPPVRSTRLRPMHWSDIDVAARAEEQLFGPTAWSESTWWSELSGVPERRYYVVVDDAGALAGYAGLAFLGAEADVQTVAVLPHAQGRGLGRALLDDLEQQALARACTRLLLEVRADNAAALAMYTAAGFAVDGTRRDYYDRGVDAVLMSKSLRPASMKGGA